MFGWKVEGNWVMPMVSVSRECSLGQRAAVEQARTAKIEDEAGGPLAGSRHQPHSTSNGYRLEQPIAEPLCGGGIFGGDVCQGRALMASNSTIT